VTVSIHNSSPVLSRWQPYPEYKDSSIKWLGEIPSHWEVKRLRRVFKVINGSTPKTSESAYWDGDINWITPDDLGQLQTDTIVSSSRKITEKGYRSCGVSLVPAGSLVLSTRAPIGHLGIAGVALCTNQGCRSLVFQCHGDTRFFYYHLVVARPELQSWGQGATFTELSKTRLEEIYLVFPDEIEQRAISTFLDRETARIDRLIAAKERLIALLQEKRAALISHAVTKGLDPNVPMKDSGVEWLGEIPAHWEVKRLKHLGKAIIGLTYSPSDVTNNADDTLVLRASNVKDGNLAFEDAVYVNSQIPAEILTREGDILICSRSGSRSLIGKNARIDGAGIGVTFGAFMTIFRSVYNMYLSYVFNSSLFEQQSGSFMTSTINQLTVSTLNNIQVPFPPRNEQWAIAIQLENELRKIDAIVTATQTAIIHLREYRSALITAAVTGKIDVRKELEA